MLTACSAARMQAGNCTSAVSYRVSVTNVYMCGELRIWVIQASDATFISLLLTHMGLLSTRRICLKFRGTQDQDAMICLVLQLYIAGKPFLKASINPPRPFLEC